MINIAEDELLLANLEESPVMDGLLFWIDGQDGLYDSNGNKISDGVEQKFGDDCYVRNRATNELLKVDFGTIDSMRVFAEDNYFWFAKMTSEGSNVKISLGNAESVLTTDFAFSCQSPVANDSFIIGSVAIEGGYAILTVYYPYRIVRTGWDGMLGLTTTSPALRKIDTKNPNYYCFVSPKFNKGRTYVNTDFVEYLRSENYTEPFEPRIQFRKYAWYTGREFGIKLSSARFYNRQLTPEEVLQNYNYEKSLGRVQ